MQIVCISFNKTVTTPWCLRKCWCVFLFEADCHHIKLYSLYLQNDVTGHGFCGTALFCSDALESLAWASAQIHCQCTTNSKVAYPDGNLFTPEELSTANTGMHCCDWLNEWLSDQQCMYVKFLSHLIILVLLGYGVTVKNAKGLMHHGDVRWC